MWNIFFALFLGSTFLAGATENNSVWFILLNVATLICAAGVVITHEKQKEKIETLENKIEKLEKLVGEDK